MDNVINLSTLVKNGSVVLDNNSHVYVDCDADVTVSNGSKVSLYEINGTHNVTVNSLANSVVTFNSVEAISGKKSFVVNGELKYVEIVTKPTKEELNITLNNEGANCDCKVLSVATVKDEYKFVQKITHNAMHTDSNISNVGVAAAGAVVTFDTTGKIDKGMAKTKCSQLSKGIVMDDVSSVTAKPILLIDEFDCFANHGASIGKMSDEDLFYLMSRGLDKNQAFLLILQGMIKPYIDSLELDALKEEVNQNIQKMIVK